MLFDVFVLELRAFGASRSFRFSVYSGSLPVRTQVSLSVRQAMLRPRDCVGKGCIFILVCWLVVTWGVDCGNKDCYQSLGIALRGPGGGFLELGLQVED